MYTSKASWCSQERFNELHGTRIRHFVSDMYDGLERAEPCRLNFHEQVCFTGRLRLASSFLNSPTLSVVDNSICETNRREYCLYKNQSL